MGQVLSRVEISGRKRSGRSDDSDCASCLSPQYSQALGTQEICHLYLILENIQIASIGSSQKVGKSENPGEGRALLEFVTFCRKNCSTSTVGVLHRGKDRRKFTAKSFWNQHY